MSQEGLRPDPLSSRIAAGWAEVTVGLSEWLPAQRWFAGKARTVEDVGLTDVAALDDRLVGLMVDVTYRDGAPERYQVPLVPSGPGATVATVGGLPLTDALEDDDACLLLARLTAPGAEVAGPVRRLGVEQSNSSAVFADTHILKVLRRLEPGENPEVELTRALTHAGSPHVPPLRGVLSHEDGGETTTLAVLADFVDGGREGWALATAEAERVAAGRPGDPARPPLAARMRDLGAAVESVHATLRRSLASRPATAGDLTGWMASMRSQLERVLAIAGQLAVDQTAAVLSIRPELERTIAHLSEVGDAGQLIRIHGDLHLGQVLLDGADRWQILDFEGEPARPLRERRLLSSPLRDVAGMLRSFDYAAGHAALASPDADAGRLAAWREELRKSFLDGYVQAAQAADVLPGTDRDVRLLLAVFELDKAVYELGYELANRPDWVTIPVGGILRLVDQLKEEPPVRPSAKSPAWRAPPADVTVLIEGRAGDPHRILGVHPGAGGTAVRAYRPDASAIDLVLTDGLVEPMEQTDGRGFFEALVPSKPAAGSYRLRVSYPDGVQYELVDPYAFWPTLGDLDVHLLAEGRHEELWRRMGAHVQRVEGITGTSFAVWAPNARGVRVVGDFNSWDGRLHPMRLLGESGIWELFLPDVGPGERYKFELVTAAGQVVTRADPYAFATETPPGTASRIHDSVYQWGDADWLAERRENIAVSSPMSIYEVHLGSWRHRDGRPLGYRQLAEELAAHVKALGFTHVELLPPAEHPFGGSWGYQVTGYFAPSARYGEPDDFRYFIDTLHQEGIGVLVDWVPAHFPRDEWALARFDGTALYEHADPRQGEHPDWGTLVFNFGRNEVRNFLIANALYWLEELHVDGLRVDAVASMLYLDYSRQPGEWVPNVFGGRENLEAVSFLKELNTVVYGRNPDVMLIAEESTAWPGVSRPTHLGGLGFGFKWNMGWMHDTLSYLSRDPVHRRFHHSQLTFGLMYAFSENFILPLSHDEVVHQKGSLLEKMAGDRRAKFANLRALYGYLWAHPGKQLLFMGAEFGQWREWAEQRELDWFLLEEPEHAGIQTLVADLNARYRELPALWRRDSESAGFSWIDANDADNNVVSFLRFAGDGEPAVVCVCNFAAVPHRMRVGLPSPERYREVLNTDSEAYGGGNSGNWGSVQAESVAWHGQPASAVLTIPPLSTLWLAQD